MIYINIKMNTSPTKYTISILYNVTIHYDIIYIIYNKMHWNFKIISP